LAPGQEGKEGASVGQGVGRQRNVDADTFDYVWWVWGNNGLYCLSAGEKGGKRKTHQETILSLRSPR